MNFIVRNKLEVANRGNEPTFVTTTCREAIDITIVTTTISTVVVGWHVSQEQSLSDHRYIRFDIKALGKKVGTYRDPRACNWGFYQEHLERGLEECPIRPQTPAETELRAEAITTAINTAYYNSCLEKERKDKRRIQWWNSNLSYLRTNTRKLFNRAKKNGDWESFKSSRKEYMYAIRKAKENSWR